MTGKNIENQFKEWRKLRYLLRLAEVRYSIARSRIERGSAARPPTRSTPIDPRPAWVEKRQPQRDALLLPGLIRGLRRKLGVGHSRRDS